MITSGRTLFGAPAPKGQELEDQYFGAIKDPISAFMKDLDTELWKMGVSAKTKHNEVAPSQYEMAPIFSTVNIATDHNQLVMETMQKVALRHDLVCLLHEKPFAGVNGSGKHNNWSLATDDGHNLLEPGKTPHDNAQFLLFVAAVLQAVDKHADKLRATAANPGNDLRLGANEAPPAIISVFMGEELFDILNAIGAGKKGQGKGENFLTIGVDSLPALPKDNTDRNRTSPFAFTGNKFEFRMVPSSASIAGPNTVLNTVVAESLDEISTRLEKASDVTKEAGIIVKEVVNKHGRVVFNGNGYSEEWVTEAEKRGLPNIKSTVEALGRMATPEAEALFAKYKVLSKEEIHSRYEIYLEQYAKHQNIEAQASIDMVRKLYLPAVMKYAGELGQVIATLKSISAPVDVQTKKIMAISSLLASSEAKLGKLEAVLKKAQEISETKEKAFSYREKVVPAMNELRGDIDGLEGYLPTGSWPVPSYADMLFKL